jgi:hypothetical protein
VKTNNGENFNSGPAAPPHLTVMHDEPKPIPPPTVNAPTPPIPIDAAVATPPTPPGEPGSGTGTAAAPARPEEGSAIPPGEHEVNPNPRDLPANGTLSPGGGQPAGEPSRLR